MSDASIGAFTRLVRQDPDAAARALKAALSDDALSALREAMDKAEGWTVVQVDTRDENIYAGGAPGWPLRGIMRQQITTRERYTPSEQLPPATLHEERDDEQRADALSLDEDGWA